MVDMGDPTEGRPLGPSCSRNEPHAGSPKGFHWSISCHAQLEMWSPKVAVLGDGGVVLAFMFAYDTAPAGQATVDLGGGPFLNAGNSDVIVARFDAEGQHVWSQLWGSDHSERTFALAALPDGGVVIGLTFGSTVMVGGELLASESEQDEILINLNAAGQLRWSRRLRPAGVADWSTIWDVDSAADGTVAMAAYVSGAIEIEFDKVYVAEPSGASLLAIVEADGALRRTEIHQGLYVSSLSISDDGSLTFATDDSLRRATPTGTPQWTLSGWAKADSNAALHVGHIGQTSSGDITIAGTFSGTVNFGGNDLVNADFHTEDGNFDIFVARFGANGAHRWSVQRNGPIGFPKIAMVRTNLADQVHLAYGAEAMPTYLEILGKAGATVAARTIAASGASGGGLAPDDTLVIAGSSSEPIDLGGGLNSDYGVPQVWFGRLTVD